MEKDEIVVYWSPFWGKGEDDWNLLYPKPKTLFSSIKDHSVKSNDNIDGLQKLPILSCPATSEKYKKIAVFESPISCSYKYDFSNFLKNAKFILEPETKQYLSYSVDRQPVTDYGPSIVFSLRYSLFAEESLDAFFTPPMFHPPKYTKNGSVIPAEFNIGKWFRPFNFEVQMWQQNGRFILEEKEPLFYVEFKTNKKVILKRFKMTDQLYDAAKACINSSNLFGKGQSLEDRYQKFENTDMRDIVLSEIKENIVSESSPINI